MSFFIGAREEHEGGHPVRAADPLLLLSQQAVWQSAWRDLVALLFLVIIISPLMFLKHRWTYITFWVFFAVYLMASGVRICKMFFQLNELAQDHATEDTEPRENELVVQMPASPSNPVADAGMTDGEINALPVHEYRSHIDHGSIDRVGRDVQKSSSSNAAINEKSEDTIQSEEMMETREYVLTCNICLDDVNSGELVKCLPCLHEFHGNCIDQWLQLHGKCPICRSSAALKVTVAG